MFIAGGCSRNVDQISRLDGTQFTVVANAGPTLHDCVAGSNDYYAIITSSSNNILFRPDGNVTLTQNTGYVHHQGSISSINNNVVIFIGNTAESYRTEEYSVESNQWQTVSNTNIWQATVYKTSSVAIKNYIYNLGGNNAENSIFRMNNNYEWTKLSETLRSSRKEHTAIGNGKYHFERNIRTTFN